MARDRRKVGGPSWNKVMEQAHKANNAARTALQHIATHVQQNPHVSPLLIAQHLTRAALALAENQDALRELNTIAQGGTK